MNGNQIGASFVIPFFDTAVTIGGHVYIDGGPGGEWNTAGANGDFGDLALVLLHELGHVYNNLKGSGGSSILYDGFGGIFGNTSVKNSDIVAKACLN